MAPTDHTLDERTHQLLIKVAHGLIAVVGVIVLIVSSYYLRRYAINTGMPEWLAWTLFVALDAGGVAGTLCWLLATGPIRTWGRVIALANLTVSILGNVLGHLIEAGMLPVTPLLVILTGVVYPAELWALVHLGILLRTENTAPVETNQPPQAQTPLTATPPSPDTVTRTTPPPPVPVTLPQRHTTPARAPRFTPTPMRGGHLREGHANSRQRKVTPEVETRIRALWKQGLTLQEVMLRSGYKRSTCIRIKSESERENRVAS